MATNQKLLDWLDDLCVRFIVNLPHEELQSVERICFQIEEAQWYYEDFIRPLDPSLPSMNLRVFSQRMFQHCPLFAGFTAAHREGAYEQFLQYKTRVPVRGAIMLNQDMTHAVLVKGWKKGAKWSFPRGKINKDESDLDCAVREVYEETGLDLHEAGLVQPEEKMKSIDVTMREQSLKLYVFRGVPMDTNFEPRTRKEISKIDWYKLSDLPTLRRKNHPQGNGQDLKDNSFYMVTPFIPQLRSWIKSQRQLEKRNKHAGAHLPTPVPTGITDTELEGDLGDTTADEAAIPEYDPDGANFAELVANLGRSHRASDALPEVQLEQSTVDPAAELKRLLSVGGGGFLPQGQMLETPPIDTMIPQSNGLFELLQGNNEPHSNTLPTTPFDQMMPTPQMPQSPHGQHHPRQPHFEQMAPPPHFPFHPQGQSFPGPQRHPQMPSQPNNGFPPQLPPQFFPPPQHQQTFPPHHPNMQQPFPQQPPRQFVQTNDASFAAPQGFQNQRGPAVPPASKLPPPKLTTHTLNLLNAFKLSEKPAVMSPRSPRDQSQSFQATPTMTQPPAIHRAPESYMSSPGTQSANPYAPSPPAFQSPPLVDNIQPAQPRPRNAHQTSLLSLFRSPSIPAATLEPVKSHGEAAELSAVPPTPGHARVKSGSKAVPPMPNMNAKPVLNTAPPQPNKPGNTSATVRGPVNAPDFDTVKKNTHHGSNRTSRGPSPANPPRVEQKTFVPQQILKREGTPKHAARRNDVSSPASPQTVVAAKTVFKPQILKRPQHPNDRGAAIPTQAPATKPDPKAQVPDLLSLFKAQASPKPAAEVPAGPTQPAKAAPPAPRSNAHAQELLGLFKSPSPAQQIPTQFTQPPPQKPASYDRPAEMPPPPPPADQKAALLSLFSKASPKPSSPSPFTSAEQSRLTQSPTAIVHGMHSPTGHKNIISGVVSPVSPLPAGGSASDTPAHAMSRSRISSIGESVGVGSFPGVGVSVGIGAPRNMAPAPTSHPSAMNGVGENVGGIGIGAGYGAGGAGAGTGVGFDSSLPHPGGGGAGNANTAGVGGGKSPAVDDNNKTFLLGFLNDFANKGR
ncbi:hypothetical protein DM02DRAFT_619349 [Periconia macrospinosa]|uniref:Nudix hydrolase domain-containing protein n=1 Tax=Periconia macrospinosa TaxID=97972 RepID=A0A2V1D5H1_9PLEO|nr:hypothetical protein DM02DRAFT_619349 [Periconia macrospinosa]